MIADLKPYPEYKDSGVPWLGRVPGHWGLSRSKRLFSARKDLALPEDVQLSATQAYGVIPQSDFEAKVGRRVVKISMHLEKRRHVEKDDFVISMRSFQGGIERAWASGAIRSSYVVLKPEPNVNIEFFAHLFKSHSYIRALQATSDFIRDGQDLNFSNFCGVDLPAVPLVEQAAIARFLEWANRRLERAIRAKRKVIALLNEQKQAIIQRAVTRGLATNGSLKSSGLSWLGDIPAHWEVRRLKTLTSLVTSGSRGWARYYSDTGPTFLRIGNISTTSVDLKLNRIVHVAPPADAEGERTRVIHNDLLLSITAQMGAVGIVPPDIGEAYVNQHTALVRLKAATSYPRWVAYCLLSQVGKRQCQLRTNGGTKVGLTLDDVRTLLVLSPPEVEQREIVADIDRRTLRLDSAIQAAEREIDLLREYRTRVVAEVATGQLDVREAAAGLPAEMEGSDVVAEVDDETEELLEEVADDE